MKKTILLILMLAAMMLSACSSSSENETSHEVWDLSKPVNSDTADNSSAESADGEKTADTESTSQENGYSPEVIITADGVSHTDYLTGTYTFAADGLSGTFKVSTIDAYSADYVKSLKVGDIIPNAKEIWDSETNAYRYEDLVIESVEYDEDFESYRINGYQRNFNLQESGAYYLSDSPGFMKTTSAGEKELRIAPDVIIVENAYPFWREGIIAENEPLYYQNIAEFVDKLDDGNVINTPTLFLRVVDDEIKLIVVNPYNHEPWYIPAEYYTPAS